MIRLFILTLSILLLLPVAGVAKEKPTTISAGVYKKLKKTEALIAKKSYSQAEKNLKALLTKVKQNSFEQATVLRSLSSVYALKGQYKSAARELLKCLNLKVLPRSQELQATLNLGQLYMATEQYRRAINTLEPWLANNSNPDAQINVLLANAYAQIKKYRPALRYIKKAIRQTKKPAESWYQLNLALNFELNQYRAAATTLKTLIRLYPDKKSYWSQLSSVYQQLKQYNEAVSVKNMAYKNGFINSEKSLLELVNLLTYVGSPFKAATLLKTGIDQKKITSTAKNWETLAQTWTLAKEYNLAIKALETASKLDSKGKLYQQLGQIFVEQENWARAIVALQKAINKGNIKNTGNTYVLLGMSNYELNKIKLAKKYFSKATQYSKSKKTALQWLNYIKTPKE